MNPNEQQQTVTGTVVNRVGEQYAYTPKVVDAAIITATSAGVDPKQADAAGIVKQAIEMGAKVVAVRG